MTDMDDTGRVRVARRSWTVINMDCIGRAWAAWRRRGPEWGSPVSRSLVEPYTQADVEEP
jgi:hypothetical protein